MEVDYPDPLRVRPAVGERMRAILKRAMAKSPDDRFASANEFGAELRSFVRALGIDDPEATLRKYLSDPATVTVETEARIVAMSIRDGKAAAQRGDVPAAQAAYNRALAIDESNAEVLTLVQRLGEAATSKKRWLWVSATGVVLIGIALLASLVDTNTSTLRDPHVIADRALARTAVDRPPPRPRVTPVVLDASIASARDAGSVRGQLVVERVRPDAAAAVATAQVTGPRAITFRPDPQNVSIAIDDGPLVPFGPAFRSTSLEPGRHRIRIVPGTECCEESAFGIDVTPGTTPLVVARTLQYRPARLYVVTDTPADVVIFPQTGPSVRGRSREFLTVPLGSTDAQVRLVVTAEGRADYTGQVRLRAGALVERTVVLGPQPVP
jgi:hypothetical protein